MKVMFRIPQQDGVIISRGSIFLCRSPHREEVAAAVIALGEANTIITLIQPFVMACALSQR